MLLCRIKKRKLFSAIEKFWVWQQGVITTFGRDVSRKPRLGGGVKGHNMSETSFSGSPALGGKLQKASVIVET